MVGQVETAMQPVLQYGFAGMCVILLSGFYVLARAGLRVWEKSSENQRQATDALQTQMGETRLVIVQNTAALEQLKVELKGQKTAIYELTEELVRRPCMAPREKH